MVTTLAMFLRNLIILAIFAPASVATALLPLGSMTLAALFAVYAIEIGPRDTYSSFATFLPGVASARS